MAADARDVVTAYVTRRDVEAAGAFTRRLAPPHAPGLIGLFRERDGTAQSLTGDVAAQLEHAAAAG